MVTEITQTRSLHPSTRAEAEKVREELTTRQKALKHSDFQKLITKEENQILSSLLTEAIEELDALIPTLTGSGVLT